MRFFIACLVIYGFDLHWSLYLIALAIAIFEWYFFGNSYMLTEDLRRIQQESMMDAHNRLSSWRS